MNAKAINVRCRDSTDPGRGEVKTIEEILTILQKFDKEKTMDAFVESKKL